MMHPFKACLAALSALWFVLSPALAQEEGSLDAAEASSQQGQVETTLDVPNIDDDLWERLASRVETTLAAGNASTEAFETQRSQVAAFRAQFLEAQGTNAARIATLRSQIEALGPAPAEGESEPEPVATRRADLEAQLERARAPVRAAEEAYNRANGLISEIDTVIRNRQTTRLLSGGPSPLNPAHWGAAWSQLAQSFGQLSREVTRPFQSQVRRAEMIENAPAALVFLALAFMLLVRGRSWSRRAGEWLLQRGRRGARVWSFLISLGQIILPLMGILALVLAVYVTRLVGIRSDLILQSLPAWALTLLVVRWLADRLFSRHDGDRMLPMDRIHRNEARYYAGVFAIVAVIGEVLYVFNEYDKYPEEVEAVLNFPLLLVTSLVLFRFGQLLSTKLRFGVVLDSESDEPKPMPMRLRLARILGRAARLIAIVGPLLAAAGYTSASEALVYPAVGTLLLAGLVLVAQRFVSDVYRFVAKQPDDEDDSLITVLFGFLITLAALPVLAFIWGARVADITEIWTRFREGFTFGDTRIQPTDFITLVVVFALLYSATRLLQAALRNSVLPKTRLDTGGQNAIVAGTGYVGIFLAALVAISSTGLDLSSLAIVAGALSVGIGFGLQNIVSNFVSGIILLIERPIAEGDWIEVGSNMGYVKDISVRSTRIQTFDRTDVIVPNADLVSGTVTNFTRGNTIGRVIVPVGVAYGTDTRRVEGILMDIARRHDMVLMNPAPTVVFQGFGADSLDFEIRAILRDVNYVLSVKSDMNHEIARRFAEEGIEIPFAQRDVWLRNPEALQATPTTDAPARRQTKDDFDISDSSSDGADDGSD